MKIQGANLDSVVKAYACGAGGPQSQQPSPAGAALAMLCGAQLGGSWGLVWAGQGFSDLVGRNNHY